MRCELSMRDNREGRLATEPSYSLLLGGGGSLLGGGLATSGDLLGELS